MSYQQRHPRMRRAIALAVLGTIGLAACGGDDDAGVSVVDDGASVAVADAPADSATAGETSPAFGLVTPQQAFDLSGREDITVIDVRTPEEFAEGHIDGATMIDFYADTFGDDIGALDPSGTYLLYCRSGNRSGQAAALMQQLGFEQVYDMDGGVVAYGADGLPLVR